MKRVITDVDAAGRSCVASVDEVAPAAPATTLPPPQPASASAVHIDQGPTLHAAGRRARLAGP
jgi:hypothetical protein